MCLLQNRENEGKRDLQEYLGNYYHTGSESTSSAQTYVKKVSQYGVKVRTFEFILFFKYDKRMDQGAVHGENFLGKFSIMI